MRYLWAIPIVILGCSSESTQDDSSGPGWSVLKEFSPWSPCLRDGVLRLHYAMTGGAAVFDADLDGDLDIFLTGTSAQTPQTYWEQTGPLVFENRTNGSGLESAVFGVGATAGILMEMAIQIWSSRASKAQCCIEAKAMERSFWISRFRRTTAFRGDIC